MNDQNRQPEVKENLPKRNFNLAILAVVAIIIALITTSISLFIYKITGDIYIDRSRPGYISKEEEGKISDDGQSKKTTYTFSPDGKVTKKTLKKYLKNFEEVQKRTQESEVFGEAPLSDESLGISGD